MNSGYCLDSDILISAHRRFYPFDIFPGFWEMIEVNAEKDIVKIPLAVYEELLRGSKEDELKRWVKKHKKILIVEPDDDIMERYGEIANFVNDHYEVKYIDEFIKGENADPFVIATAWAKGMTVVTLESVKKENIDKNTGKIKGKIKIPNICIHLGVPNITFTEMLRDIGVKFVLQ